MKAPGDWRHGGRSRARGGARRGIVRGAVVAALCSVVWTPSPARADSPQPPKTLEGRPKAERDEYCLACHTDPGLKTSRTPAVSLVVDYDSYRETRHGKEGIRCVECHPTMSTVPHVLLPSLRANNRQIVKQQCARCHKEAFASYEGDVHGSAFIGGKNLEAASCTDCHGVHDMAPPKQAEFRVAVFDACTRCHSDEALMERSGIATNSVTTYDAEFHGLSTRIGRMQGVPSARWAVCPDCHGWHGISKPSDPSSSVSRENRIKVCGKCHANAPAQFAFSSSGHLQAAQKPKPAYFANLFYKFAIPGGVGTMMMYMLLETFRFAILRRRRRKSP